MKDKAQIDGSGAVSHLGYDAPRRAANDAPGLPAEAHDVHRARQRRRDHIAHAGLFGALGDGPSYGVQQPLDAG